MSSSALAAHCLVCTSCYMYTLTNQRITLRKANSRVSYLLVLDSRLCEHSVEQHSSPCLQIWLHKLIQVFYMQFHVSNKQTNKLIKPSSLLVELQSPCLSVNKTF